MNSIKQVHKAYGKNYKSTAPSIGLFEGNEAQYAEAIIHDLCHAALLGLEVPHGKCGSYQTKKVFGTHTLLQHVDNAVTRLRYKMRQDLNEVRAIAAELLVLKMLDIQLTRSTVLTTGVLNSQLFKIVREDTPSIRFGKAVRKAGRTRRVREAAKQVVKFVQEGSWT